MRPNPGDTGIIVTLISRSVFIWHGFSYTFKITLLDFIGLKVTRSPQDLGVVFPQFSY